MSLKEVVTQMQGSLKNLQALLIEVSDEIAHLQADGDGSQDDLAVMEQTKINLLQAIEEVEYLLRMHAVQEVTDAKLLAAQWEKSTMEEEYAEKTEELDACYRKISEISCVNCSLEDQLHNAAFDAQMNVFDTSLNALNERAFIYSPTSVCSIGDSNRIQTVQSLLQVIKKQSDAGNLNIVIDLCTEAIASLETGYGKDHIDIGNLSLELYKSYMKKGMTDKASQYLRSAQRIYEKAYKGDEQSGILDLLSRLFRKSEVHKEEDEILQLTPVMNEQNSRSVL